MLYCSFSGFDFVVRSLKMRTHCGCLDVWIGVNIWGFQFLSFSVELIQSLWCIFAINDLYARKRNLNIVKSISISNKCCSSEHCKHQRILKKLLWEKCYLTTKWTYVTLDHKTSSSTGIFVAIANNTLYGSKLSIFLLCQKSLGY